MARSESQPELFALARVRAAYTRSHIAAAARGAIVAIALAAVAFVLHRTTPATWLAAGTLAISLAWLGWRGGAWRRGSFAGVLAGLPPLISPVIVAALGAGPHCDHCVSEPSLVCALVCFGSASIVGAAVGARAHRDRAPSRYTLAAITSAGLTGALGCGSTGLGGAIGIAVGLVAGVATGWATTQRASAAP